MKYSFTLSLSEIENLEPWILKGISTDSRTIQVGQLFVALRGLHYDAHDFISEAVSRGAGALLVSEKVSIPQSIPIFYVSDTMRALQELAMQWRLKFHIPIVALTGSVGKTSTRGLLHRIFEECGPTWSSPKSFNNQYGVPLSLLGLRSEHRYAVFELGANAPKEIESLVQLVQPTVALITQVAAAHLEGFKDLDGVFRAKSEIYDGLSQDGTAVIPKDDAYAESWLKRCAHKKCVTFGLHPDADIRATDIDSHPQQSHFTLVTPIGKKDITLPLSGTHHIHNALAAAAAAIAVHIPLECIKNGLSNACSEPQRLVVHHLPEGMTLIDDTYNANPASVQAAVSVLAQYAGVRILILGDMRELGATSSILHEKIGHYARQEGITHLWCFGADSEHTASAFGLNGRFFKQQENLIQEACALWMHQPVTVLVKGSRSLRMERVVQAFLSQS